MVILVIEALALSRFTNSSGSPPDPRLECGPGSGGGLRARQTLANLVAGIMMRSPTVRIGDTVTIGEDTGRVDDLTLSYTYIDPGTGG